MLKKIQNNIAWLPKWWIEFTLNHSLPIVLVLL